MSEVTLISAYHPYPYNLFMYAFQRINTDDYLHTNMNMYTYKYNFEENRKLNIQIKFNSRWSFLSYM